MIVQNGRARFGPRVLPCAMGKGGVTRAKREGDGATPAGSHRLLKGYYRADRLAPPRSCLRLQPIGPGDLWSDDADDPDYNRRVRRPHPYRHERLFRADPLYDLVLVTDWNSALVRPGAGSAIFLHIWRRPGWATEGCVAFCRRDLIWLAERWTQQSRLIVQP
nr:L,D-transpeptidase family protein [Rubricella aquisinus]